MKTTKTPRLLTERHRQYALRSWVAESLRRARLTPVEGLPLSYRAAARAVSHTVSAQGLERIEAGAYLPRFRKALILARWIRSRLAMDRMEAVAK